MSQDTSKGRWAGLAVLIQIVTLLTIGSTEMDTAPQFFLTLLVFATTWLTLEGWLKMKGWRR